MLGTSDIGNFSYFSSLNWILNLPSEQIGECTPALQQDKVQHSAARISRLRTFRGNSHFEFTFWYPCFTVSFSEFTGVPFRTRVLSWCRGCIWVCPESGWFGFQASDFIWAIIRWVTFEFLCRHSRMLNDSITCHFSGGAVAIDLASRCNFRDRILALIVENTFSSIPSLAKHLFPIRLVRYLPHWCYKNRVSWME